MSGEGEKFVATLDLGTTSVRCLIIDQCGVERGQSRAQIQLEYPKPGWVEINPSVLWDQVVDVITRAIQDAGLFPSQITCMSISCQRCSFLLMDTNNNNQPLSNVITWKYTRATALVKQWNDSLYIKAFRTACKFLHTFTQNSRYMSGGCLKLMNEQVVLRLSWILQNDPGIREKIALNQVKFATLDTFIISRLTFGEVHVTDYSSASPTGFFDPFILDWADWALKLFSIPSSILPKLVPTCGDHFGSCKIFPGVQIPIYCSIADQSSSVFGSASLLPGSVKVTLGTGTFLDVNTGKSPHASVSGIYPLVGWKYGSNLVYLAEGQSKDSGSIIEWGKSIGLFDKVEETSSIAESVLHSNGAYFIPAFNGLQAPYNDNRATAGFIGVNFTTKRQHLIRALLESIAFRVHQLLNVLNFETDFQFELIKVDGGVSRNDFILQTIANLTGKRVERSISTENTALGCCYMAGIHAGIWSSPEEVQEKFYKVDKLFLPNVEEEEMVQNTFLEWERAIERFRKWTKDYKD